MEHVHVAPSHGQVRRNDELPPHRDVPSGDETCRGVGELHCVWCAVTSGCDGGEIVSCRDVDGSHDEGPPKFEVRADETIPNNVEIGVWVVHPHPNLPCSRINHGVRC